MLYEDAEYKVERERNALRRNPARGLQLTRTIRVEKRRFLGSIEMAAHSSGVSKSACRGRRKTGLEENVAGTLECGRNGGRETKRVGQKARTL